ncbi:MAG: DASS family sodium-coupled anion symporter [Gemmatimonadota bacterium]
MGLAAGPLLAGLTYISLPAAYLDGSGHAAAFSTAGRATAAAAVWMAVWWMTEAIPVYATALLPLVLLPLAGAATIRQAAAPYGHELIFLFLGGFVLALAMQRWGLHRRVAYRALRLVGTSPRHIVGGFMLITAAMSMWVSNTATAITMLPIALSVVQLVGGGAGRAEMPERHRNFALCLLLGIAYGASIGGTGTLVGTPPNLFLASYAASHLQVEISFVRWMAIGLPLVAAFLPVAWLLLTVVLYPVGSEPVEGSQELARSAAARLGPMSRGEWITLAAFGLAAGAWIGRPLLCRLEVAGTRPLAGLTDPGIAVLAALALFAVPVDCRRRVFAMDWETAVHLPWGILILFGGGLSLAAAVEANGVGDWIGNQVGGLRGLPPLLLVALVTGLMIFLTELTSNTASTATLVPIFAALAPGLGLDPLLVVVPTAVAASCAFMLPVATPPNAIVYGSGYVTIPQMCRAGLWLNLIGIVLITALAYAAVLPLLGAGR